MSTRNPCIDQDPGVEGEVNPCPPGQRLTLIDGRRLCVPDDNIENAEASDDEQTATEATTARDRDPFALESFIYGINGEIIGALTADPPAANFDDNQENNNQRAVSSDILYVSATRDVTTIGEENFYSLTKVVNYHGGQNATPDQLLSIFHANHSSIWLKQKEGSGISQGIDKFRLALLNFWNFDQKYESITVRPVGDTRVQNREEHPAPLVPERYRDFLMIQEVPTDYRLRTHYDTGRRIDFRGYNTLEEFSFSFNKTPLERTQAFLGATGPEIMDIYALGTNSIVWNQPNRIWSIPNEFGAYLTNHFGNGNIEFEKEFYDFTFDSPAAFYESEMNSILVSPFDSADVESVISNHEFRKDLDREVSIPSIYQYYQSKQIDKIIRQGGLLEESLPPGHLDFRQKTITQYESNTQNLIETPSEVETASTPEQPSGGGYSSAPPPRRASERRRRRRRRNAENQNEEIFAEDSEASTGLRVLQSGTRTDGPMTEGQAMTSTANVADTTPLELLEGQEINEQTINRFLSSRKLKFPSEKVELLDEINKSVIGTLSNYIRLTINTTQATPINSSLQRNKMGNLILELFQQAGGLNHWANQSSWEPLALADKIVDRKFTKVLDDQFIEADTGERVEQTVNDRAVENINETIILQIDKILNLAINDYISIGPNGERTFHEHDSQSDIFWPRDLKDYPLHYGGWENERRLRFEEIIRSQIFLSELEQLIDSGNLQRSYSDILYGRKAYAEVIGYKVEKYKVEDGNETYIQEFLFMNNDNVKDIEFLDTQIIPGRQYKYKFYTINFVIGSKYSFYSNDQTYQWREAGGESLKAASNGNEFLKFQAYSNRLVSIIHSPFFEKTVSSVDYPPVTPDVTFLPYVGVDNNYSVILKSSFGESKEKPIPVLPKDEEVIASTYRNQRVPAGSELTYRSDSLPTHFELIRIDSAPESYQDFNSPTALVIKRPAQGNTCFINISDIVPNKYYYYIFRAVDDFGFSNPTEVYRVRMVSYQNGIFMDLETYEMYKKPKDFSVFFNSALKISPSFDQRVINFDKVLESIDEDTNTSALNLLRQELGLKKKSDLKSFQLSAPDVGEVKLGKTSDEDKVWDKKFKFRCTSKTTGKKIDFNITFSQKKTQILKQ